VRPLSPLHHEFRLAGVALVCFRREGRFPAKGNLAHSRGQAARPMRWRQKTWMKTFGQLRHLHKETAKIDRIIEEEFDQIVVD